MTVYTIHQLSAAVLGALGAAPWPSPPHPGRGGGVGQDTPAVRGEGWGGFGGASSPAPAGEVTTLQHRDRAAKSAEAS